jgi:hypothetical protein
MYEAFDKFLAVPTWHTTHDLDGERFYRALHQVVKDDAFNPDAMADDMHQKLGVPRGCGEISGCSRLLVGNFGDGTINAFNLNTDQFKGALKGADGKPIVIGDLWAISPGNGGSGGSTDTIYFTAGVQNEAHGLFGSITPNMA